MGNSIKAINLCILGYPIVHIDVPLGRPCKESIEDDMPGSEVPAIGPFHM